MGKLTRGLRGAVLIGRDRMRVTDCSGARDSGKSAAMPVSRITVHLDEPGPIIAPELYGHFAEHLGACVYDGLWVGQESSIPNVGGIRSDVLDALKRLEIPVLRWPGGCFADDYHWEDGIGPAKD